jgi:poly(hydroxyalkanoate) depolymerase family esterase
VLGLGQTTDKLARYRHQWERFLAASKASRAAADAGAPQATLFPSGRASFEPRQSSHADVCARAPAGECTARRRATRLHADRHQLRCRRGLVDPCGAARLRPAAAGAASREHPNTCFTWFSAEDTARDRGEAIAHMELAHGIDRERIYITGLSAGGAMASVMLVTYPGVFAGGAIIAGLPYGAATSVQQAFDAMFQATPRPARVLGDCVRAASPHAGPWPKISVWHGSADQTVMPANADEIVKQWTDVHGLSATRSRETSVNGHRRRVWHNEASDAVIESYTIAGMAHGAPVGAEYGRAATFILDAGVSSTLRIAEFWALTAAQPAEAAAHKWKQRWKPQATSMPASGIVIDEEGGVVEDAPDHAAKPAPDSGNAAEDGSGAPRFDLGSVITKALRTAGLMK